MSVFVLLVYCCIVSVSKMYFKAVDYTVMFPSEAAL